MRNEVILLLTKIMISVIQSKNYLTFDEFVELIIEKNLLFDVEKAYDFLDKATNPIAHVHLKPRMRKTDSIVTELL